MNNNSVNSNLPQEAPVNTQPQEEKASVGLAILSFLIPLVGLILFITKKKERPKTAKACGICALVSFVLSIVLSVIISVAGTSALLSSDFESEDDSFSYSDELDYGEDEEAALEEWLADAEN